MNEIIVLDGHFNKYIYNSKENDYFISSISLTNSAILDLKTYIKDSNFQYNLDDTLGNKTDITLLGTSKVFQDEVQPNISYSFNVKVKYDNKYNKYQLEMVNFFENIPVTEDEIISFLSNKMPTIGKVKAKKIVTHFGFENIDDIFGNNIERLLELPFIKKEQLTIFKTKWNKNKYIFKIMTYSKGFDISNAVANKIFEKFKYESLNIMRDAPYSLCSINGLSFLSADKIASVNGVNMTDNNRILFGLKYAIEDLINKSGDTLVTIDAVLTRAVSLLDLNPELILGYINLLIKKNKFINVKGRLITTDKIHTIEKEIYNIMLTIIENNDSRQLLPIRYIEDFKEKNEFGLDEYQLNSVVSIFKNKINVLTGGPGTGKTHTIKSVVSTFMDNGLVVNLLAPTGKASQKMTESTGIPAETIHRFLKIKPIDNEEDDDYDFNSDNNVEIIESDLLIIDESSMIDIYLIHTLLKRVDIKRTAILFVGDIDQLPPVGLGSFFKDIIESNVINVCRLNKLHRTSENSKIAINAYNIKHDKKMILDKSDDFELISTKSNKETMNKIKKIYKELMDSGESTLDVQILSPRREADLSCAMINKEVRPIANKNFNEEDVGKGSLKFIIDDKVMQKKNNYSLGVFNGDTGIITDYDMIEEETNIRFGNPNYKVTDIKYPSALLNELELSYCTTIHKSQGSDYDYVIIPLTKSHLGMWSKRLLYTAITRTKKKIFLIGDKSILSLALKKEKNENRKTTLSFLFKNNDIVIENKNDILEAI